MTTKTPIQEAITNMNNVKSILQVTDEYTQERSEILEGVIENLKSLIPKERQFAQTCFDAGRAKGYDDTIVVRGLENAEPDFPTFYKQYEDEK